MRSLMTTYLRLLPLDELVAAAASGDGKRLTSAASVSLRKKTAMHRLIIHKVDIFK